jgi:hypothetical protein
MNAHHGVCKSCRQAALDERRLSLQWQKLPQAPRSVALWQRVVQRLDIPAPRQRRPVFAAWSLGSAMAMVALLCAVLWPRLPDHRSEEAKTSGLAIAAAMDEHHIVQMVSEVQQLPDAESDTFIAETQRDRQVMSRVLRGKEEN